MENEIYVVTEFVDKTTEPYSIDNETRLIGVFDREHAEKYINDNKYSVNAVRLNEEAETADGGPVVIADAWYYE